MTEPVSSIGGASQPAARAANPALDKAAHAFEAVFLRQMIGTMRSAKLGGEDAALFDSGASDQFRDMADARLADNMAGRFGIAEMLTKQFGGKQAPAAPAVAPPAAPAASLP